MRKISAWNPEYLKALVPKTVRLLDEHFEDFDNYEDGEVVLDEKDVFDHICEFLLEQEELEGLLCTDDFDIFVETFWIRFNRSEPKYFENKREELMESLREAIQLQRDPLGYYGMSQKDFI